MVVVCSPLDCRQTFFVLVAGVLLYGFGSGWLLVHFYMVVSVFVVVARALLCGF